MKIKFDNTNNPEQPTIVLASKSGRLQGMIPATDIKIKDCMNAASEMSFEVQKVNCHDLGVWDKIKDFRLVWVKEWNEFFEIHPTLKDSTHISKSVQAISLGEAELSQINVNGLEVNTEDDIARDDYVAKTIYNADDKKKSILDLLLEKAPHYTVSHVDNSIASLQRSFSFDGKSIYDCLQEIAKEVDCIFEIKCAMSSDGEMQRKIAVYDLESVCIDCGARGDFNGKCEKCGSENITTGYGNDTTIFVSSENLTDEVSYETDEDSVKNCFRLEGGDELMTAAIVSCNPNGSEYIWHISENERADMTDELAQKLTEYDEKYNEYQTSHEYVLDEEIVNKYNGLVTKYKKLSGTKLPSAEQISSSVIGYPELMQNYYNAIDFLGYLQNSLMPDVTIPSTTAETEVNKLTANNLSPVAVQNIKDCSLATAVSAATAMAKVIVDPRFKVKTSNETLSDYNTTSQTRTLTIKFTVTSYADETDTATSVGTIDITISGDYEKFVTQKIEKLLDKKTGDITEISTLFKSETGVFKEELKKYSLARLSSFADSCQGCIDILIEQGVSDKDNQPDLYNKLYLPYYNKLSYINQELELRENEIGIVNGTYDKDGEITSGGILPEITDYCTKTQEALNFKAFIGDYWTELASYRREDTYSNNNYISDGLNNAELFDRALEFIAAAKKEIVKSSTLQHSINATLKNLLVMKEFSSIVDDFQVGNWLRVKVDDEIYRLRLLNFEIDYDNLDNLSVTFSDVKNAAGYASDVESVLSQASSMASSYSYVAKQASNGNKGKSQLDNWASRGLDLTKMKIVDNADNQEVTWDSHGILCREYSPITDSYDDKQLKILHKGLFLTDDNWKTSKAGIGNFYYIDPETNEVKEAYGVIANTLIGNLILSEKVKIFNESGSVKIDENGLNIITSAENEDSPQTVFSIKRKENDGETIVLSVDSNGRLILNGSAQITTGSDDIIGNIIGVTETANQVKKAASELEQKANSISATIGEISEGETVIGKINDIKASAEKLSINITNIRDGITSVGSLKNTTDLTDFSFGTDGLIISKILKVGEKQISKFKTTIDDNGMTVAENSSDGTGEDSWTDVLTADNQGVLARNLHATTYLIVGNRSRFENYDKDGNKYTGCFWIGG